VRILRKPLYIGTTCQVMELQALATSEGTYKERHQAARTAIGKSLVGHRVGILKIGGKDALVPEKEIEGLPVGVKPKAYATVSACDDLGVIALQ